MAEEKYPGQLDSYMEMFGGMPEGHGVQVLDPTPVGPEERLRETPQQIFARKLREDPTAAFEANLKQSEVPHVNSTPREYINLETAVAAFGNEVFSLQPADYRTVVKCVLRSYRRYNQERFRAIQTGFLSSLRTTRRRRKAVPRVSRKTQSVAHAVATAPSTESVHKVRKTRITKNKAVREVSSPSQSPTLAGDDT